jgi:Flp pilus assembly protein TadG
MGLTFDLGRMFIVKNELQVFCDSAALGAARHLDGSRSGLDDAHEIALNGPLGASNPNYVNFDTQRVTGVTDTYATLRDATYQSYAAASSTATNTFRFVRVKGDARVSAYFLGVVIAGLSSIPVSAEAVAGQARKPSTFSGAGLVPFSPAAHNPSDLQNFGLIPGQAYTLKWGKTGTAPTSNCAGDAGWPLPSSFPAQRGYVDLGQGNGTNNLRKAIVFGGYPNEFTVPSTLAAGDSIEGVPGNKANPSGDALGERSGQDIDQQSVTWDQYKASLTAGTANGRRIVTSLIDDPNLSTGTGANYKVKAIGFGNFLLYPSTNYINGFPGSSGEYCAIYIGPASTSGTSSGGTDGTSLYQVMLFR